MKKNQLYVVQIKKDFTNNYGLAGRFYKGDYLTSEGTATKVLSKAAVYENRDGERFGFSDEFDDGSVLSDIFEPANVKLVLE